MLLFSESHSLALAGLLTHKHTFVQPHQTLRESLLCADVPTWWTLTVRVYLGLEASPGTI